VRKSFLMTQIYVEKGDLKAVDLAEGYINFIFRVDSASDPIAKSVLVKHARYYWLLLAESHLTRRLFGSMVRRITSLPLPAE